MPIKMKLFIDTSDPNTITIGLGDKTFTTDSRTEKSQKLLSFIDEKIGKMGFKLSDITEIEVHRGPGSYTGLRVGISVANALGWALGIPVNGKDVRKAPVVPIYG